MPLRGTTKDENGSDSPLVKGDSGLEEIARGISLAQDNPLKPSAFLPLF